MRRGVVGGAVGLAALGIGLGLAAERHVVGKARRGPDLEAGEPFFALPADRTTSVRADDGTALHVEEVGPPQAPTTLVFCHGYTQELAAWHYQRQQLAHDEAVRCVFWDQRSHGRSARGPAEGATIDQLGRDLHAVLEAVAPKGRVVLVGHSMGGMTIMALADSHPEVFGPRVVGAALVGTSTGGLNDATFGLPARLMPVTRRVLPWLTRGARRLPGPLEKGRRLGTDLAFLVARYEAFGDSGVSPTLVQFVEQMTARTRIDVIAEFYDTFTTHDKLAALDVLRRVPTLVLVGSKDRITPVEHSELIAARLDDDDAELVVVEGAGHMVQLEQPETVTQGLRRLLERSA